jgi:hypothetical protein
MNYDALDGGGLEVVCMEGVCCENSSIGWRKVRRLFFLADLHRLLSQHWLISGITRNG